MKERANLGAVLFGVAFFLTVVICAAWIVP